MSKHGHVEVLGFAVRESGLMDDQPSRLADPGEREKRAKDLRAEFRKKYVIQILLWIGTLWWSVHILTREKPGSDLLDWGVILLLWPISVLVWSCPACGENLKWGGYTGVCKKCGTFSGEPGLIRDKAGYSGP